MKKNSMSFQDLKKDIRKNASKERARASARFFKTGKGEYGEGDRFLGLTMGEVRKLSKQYRNLDFSHVVKLLESSWHEERMIGLLILVLRYEEAKSVPEKRTVFDFYIAHREAVNSWDLVDATTPNIVGDFLSQQKNRDILYRFARSKNLWERRMAILATYRFVRSGDFHDTVSLATLLLRDTHDLIHKATGWMLREIGKRDELTLIRFLEQYATEMPRTMLRYALEKFSPERRQYFLKKKSFSC